MKIGSCLPFTNGDLEKTVRDALDIGANTFMIYTSSPTSYMKKPVNRMKLDNGFQLMKNNNISLDDIIIHANYISNFASPEEPKREMAMNALRNEINTAVDMGIKRIVIHPGSYTTGTGRGGIRYVAECLNEVLKKSDDIILLIEVAGGKGKEVGRDFEEIQSILDNIKLQDKVGVCWDSTHLWDSGYDIVNDLEDVIQEFDGIVGLDKLHVIHISDSKNKCGSNKDRHENIGLGHIGAEAIYNFVHHPLLKDKIFILETPDKDRNKFKEEIAFLQNDKFNKEILKINN